MGKEIRFLKKGGIVEVVVVVVVVGVRAEK